MAEMVVTADMTAEEKVSLITDRLSNYSVRMGEVVDAGKKISHKKKQMIKSKKPRNI